MPADYTFFTMSSTAFARGSRCSCFSSASRMVLQIRGPKLSPLLLLGFWSLFYVICNTLSRLICLGARPFIPPESDASIGKAALLSVSGDSDAPLGSWAATQVITVPLEGYPAASLQQLQQGEVRTSKEYGNKKVDERRAKEQERENGGQQKHWLPEFTPASLQQLGIHDGNEHSRKQNQQLHLQRKKGSRQRKESLLQQELPQEAVRRRFLSLMHQKMPPQRQNTYFQRLPGSSAGEKVDPTSVTTAYIQSAETAAAQQEQLHHHGQRRELLIQRRTERPAKYHSELFLAGLSRGDRPQRQVVSRESRAEIRPVLVLDEQEDDLVAESKQRRKNSLLDTQHRHNGGVDHAKKSLFAPRYHSTFIGAKGGKGHVEVAQDNPSAFDKGRGGEILLETRGKSKGIGTVLAGAGLSTLLGGLNQYQQGPLAAGPAGTSVPALSGVPVAPAAAAPGVTPAGVATLPAAAAAAAMPGAVPAANMNPLVTPAMAPPAESSGHNVLPITVGIILGLVLMCLIGGCIFKRMKKKRRRVYHPDKRDPKEEVRTYLYAVFRRLSGNSNTGSSGPKEEKVDLNA